MALACALSLAAEAPSELEVEAPAGLVEADGLERLIDLAMYLAALAPPANDDRSYLRKLGFGGATQKVTVAR
jgi:succinylarginine dihydrolase